MEKKSSIQIYVLTHKKFDVPKDVLYLPLQVGKSGKEALGYPGDDTDDNISELNCYYSELTGHYWIYKNVHDQKYVGTCHYRRYLINEQEQLITKEEYLELLQEYDLITTKRVILNQSYRESFSVNHNKDVLEETGRVIHEKYPAYHEEFEKCVNSNETYFGNMFVCEKKLFDEYCEFLFTVFFEVQKRVDLYAADAYHRRVFGFISEFLLYVFCQHKNLNVKECKVGMYGEKAETRELKKTLAGFFIKKDYLGAKEYLLSVLKVRPDVLMEASDITGEVKLCMQIIATCEFEMDQYGYCILNSISDYKSLIKYFSMINQIVTAKKHHMELTRKQTDFLSNHFVTEVAYRIAEQTTES